MMIKESIQQEDKTVLNLYAPNNIVSKYARERVQNKRRHSQTYTQRFNITLSIQVRTSRQDN